MLRRWLGASGHLRGVGRPVTSALHVSSWIDRMPGSATLSKVSKSGPPPMGGGPWPLAPPSVMLVNLVMPPVSKIELDGRLAPSAVSVLVVTPVAAGAIGSFAEENGFPQPVIE